MKEDNTLPTLVIMLAVVLSFLVSAITTYKSVENELAPYMDLKKEIESIKDSLSVQHNTYTFIIPKDTIINKTININCLK